MAAPLSIRFDPEVLARLRSRAASVPGATPSGLAQRLVDEGLRMAEHPGITFRDGPAGRRASLVGGPDVWELIRFLQEIDERGEDAVDAATEMLVLSKEAVQAAIGYYTAHPEEIDRRIAEERELAERLEREWLQRQELLS